MSDPREAALERLLQHRGPMRWIDRLLDSDAQSVRVAALIRSDHLLAGADGVPAFAGIEFMAQAIAAWAGSRALRRGDAVKAGFLLGTRDYRCEIDHFAIGSELVIDAHCELFGDNGLGMFACRILIDGSVVATANVSVFEPPDSNAFLHGVSA
jgi:predicted hotdog family 3-hydroxylacyl-ACP dehydratase